jgi:hypothetical protein
MNISGTIPKNPLAEADIKVGSNFELSFMADGE